MKRDAGRPPSRAATPGSQTGAPRRTTFVTWVVPGGVPPTEVLLVHDLGGDVSVEVDGREPVIAHAGPGAAGTYSFQVVAQPAAIIVSRDMRDYVLFGRRPFVYDLRVAGRRIPYVGATRDVRRMVLGHLVFAIPSRS